MFLWLCLTESHLEGEEEEGGREANNEMKALKYERLIKFDI